VNDVWQELGLQAEFTLGAKLLEDVELGAADMTVGDENQRSDARGGFWAVVRVAAPREVPSVVTGR
jgi:hypothetical protein